jgi:hypothetical protein
MPCINPSTVSSSNPIVTRRKKINIPLYIFYMAIAEVIIIG